LADADPPRDRRRHTDIDAVHRAAFARSHSNSEPPEVQLVHDLRDHIGWVPALSHVAEDSTGAVVGHVVCTVGSIDQDTALGLGPLGVLPAHQRRGVGEALMHSVIGAADALGFAMVVLLGHVGYYSRFGFVAARSIGVIPPDASWDEHFQARALHAWKPSIAGVFRYAAPFETSERR
jgi:putative acetyltransferase